MSVRKQRLVREYNDLKGADCSEIELHPKGANWFQWECKIHPPPGSVFDGSDLVFNISIPESYPHVFPKVSACTPIFHPNINFNTGDVLLKPLQAHWSPECNLIGVARTLFALLQVPDLSAPLNAYACEIIRAGDVRAWRSICQFYKDAPPAATKA